MNNSFVYLLFVGLFWFHQLFNVCVEKTTKKYFCVCVFQQRQYSGPRTPNASPPHSPISPPVLPQRAPAISDPSVSTTRMSNTVGAPSEQLTPKQQKMRDHFKTKVPSSQMIRDYVSLISFSTDLFHDENSLLLFFILSICL